MTISIALLSELPTCYGELCLPESSSDRSLLSHHAENDTEICMQCPPQAGDSERGSRCSSRSGRHAGGGVHKARGDEFHTGLSTENTATGSWSTLTE